MLAAISHSDLLLYQAIWISYYLFSVAAGGGFWNWSAGGFVLLCLLFQGSGWLTEQISIKKYPEYRAYQKRVPLYVPSLWKLITGAAREECEKNE